MGPEGRRFSAAPAVSVRPGPTPGADERGGRVHGQTRRRLTSEPLSGQLALRRHHPVRLAVRARAEVNAKCWAATLTMNWRDVRTNDSARTSAVVTWRCCAMRLPLPGTSNCRMRGSDCPRLTGGMRVVRDRRRCARHDAGHSPGTDAPLGQARDVLPRGSVPGPADLGQLEAGEG
jgi:hypothetical protein